MPPSRKTPKKKASKSSKLMLKKKKSHDGLKAKDRKAVEALAGDYMAFLDAARTERLAVKELVVRAEKAGFERLEPPGAVTPGVGARGASGAAAGGATGGVTRGATGGVTGEAPGSGAAKRKRKRTAAGKGYYMDFRGKAFVAAVTGKQPLEKGLLIVAAHLDSPRLDLKQNPLYEDGDSNTAMLRTHYYGGMKKYHWTNIPLSLHGVVVDSKGRTIEVDVGRDPADPVLVVPDLEPHLSHVRQDKRPLTDGIKGEELQLLAGHEPLGGRDGKDSESPVKLAVLKYLHDEYGMTEEDLVSAELSAVPAFGVREVGLDRGLIGAYGHDDKGCSFAAYRALEDLLGSKGVPDRTAVAVLYDKEEIGSDSPGAAQSNLMELFTDALAAVLEPDSPSRVTRKCLEASRALSADVKSGINPCFKGVQDPPNAALLGGGVTITKYTGRGGKFGASDASAEMVGEVRRLFNSKGIVWQASETGKVDEGGGGTVAKFLAEKNMDILDVGLPVLSMHSTFEVIAKSDLWMMERACAEFFLS